MVHADGYKTEDGALHTSDPHRFHNDAGFDVRNQSSSPRVFAQRYLLASFLKKWSGWKTGKQVRDLTLVAWENTERHVFRTNQRLRELSPLRLMPDDCPERAFIKNVRKSIIRQIGKVPPADWVERSDWPTGATLDTRMGTTVGEKVCKCNITTTSEAYPYASGLLGDFSHANVRSSRQEVVPKTYKVHRTIACEPTVNAFLQ